MRRHGRRGRIGVLVRLGKAVQTCVTERPVGIARHDQRVLERLVQLRHRDSARKRGYGNGLDIPLTELLSLSGRKAVGVVNSMIWRLLRRPLAVSLVLRCDRGGHGQGEEYSAEQTHTCSTHKVLVP